MVLDWATLANRAKKWKPGTFAIFLTQKTPKHLNSGSGIFFIPEMLECWNLGKVTSIHIQKLNLITSFLADFLLNCLCKGTFSLPGLHQLCCVIVTQLLKNQRKRSRVWMLYVCVTEHSSVFMITMMKKRFRPCACVSCVSPFYSLWSHLAEPDTPAAAPPTDSWDWGSSFCSWLVWNTPAPPYAYTWTSPSLTANTHKNTHTQKSKPVEVDIIIGVFLRMDKVWWFKQSIQRGAEN